MKQLSNQTKTLSHKVCLQKFLNLFPSTTLPDGTTLTRYPASSGSQTIQVNQGGKITKVRFE